MNKKAFTLIELLSVIVILSVISAIAYPKIIDIISVSKITAYNTAKSNIINSAKLRYLADVNSSAVTEYTVDDLITSKYLKEDIKNPITNEKYENTKVVITKEDGNISYDYIQGNSAYDVISKKSEKDGLYKEKDNYVYKGIDSKNYISFNGEIYRIIKMDSYRHLYILKEEDSNLINKSNLENYIKTYYNDNYSKVIKNSISSFDILDYSDYVSSFINNDTYIENKNNIWVKHNNNYKSLSYINSNLIIEENSTIRFVIKLNNNLVITDGKGTMIDPYIINELE